VVTPYAEFLRAQEAVWAARTKFLLARIAEDETEARSCFNGVGAALPRQALTLRLSNAGDVVVWNPARVLAECEAKRKIVEQTVSGFGCLTCRDWTAEELLENTLGYLALPYADHPDYRQEWQPTER
jgi:hypothetical protein